VQAPNDKSNDTKDRFYKELDSVPVQFPKYHTKLLLGDFNSKMWREEVFKLTIKIKV
jgi:hypothetical protein